MATLKDIKIWSNPTKSEWRVYVHTQDNRQGCLYLTGNHWHEKGSCDGNLTEEEWTQARGIAVWDGKWHTVYQDQMPTPEPMPEPTPQAEPQAQAPHPATAQMPGRSLTTGKRFSSMKHHPGEPWFTDDAMWIVESAEQVTVQTEDGPDVGWAHEVREATEQEVAEYEAQRAAWQAKSKEQRVEDLLSLFPDW